MDKIHPGLKAANDLLQKKSEDYNKEGDPDSRRDYFPYGNVSYLQMLFTKFKRLEQVLLENKDTNFDSAEDSCIDLMNYSAFLYSYILENKEADLKEKVNREL